MNWLSQKKYAETFLGLLRPVAADRRGVLARGSECGPSGPRAS